MTDTPRTRAELLTDFADNQNHAITAQDMRNFVESVTVGGPGIDRVAGYGADPAVINYPTGMDVPDSTTVYFPLSDPDNPVLSYDPNGWFQFDDDYPSPDWYGETVPAGSWALLDQGVYNVGGAIAWDTNTTGRRTFYALDTCDNRVIQTDPQLDPWAWDPLYALYNSVGMHASAAALPNFGPFLWQFTLSEIRVTAETAPVAFAVTLYQNSGSTRKILGGAVNVMKIGDK